MERTSSGLIYSLFENQYTKARVGEVMIIACSRILFQVATGTKYRTKSPSPKLGLGSLQVRSWTCVLAYYEFPQLYSFFSLITFLMLSFFFWIIFFVFFFTTLEIDSITQFNYLFLFPFLSFFFLFYNFGDDSNSHIK